MATLSRDAHLALIKAQVSEAKPETRISSHWQDLCDAGLTPAARADVDSSGRPMPEGSFMAHGLFSDAECAALIGAAETSAGFGFTNYPKQYRGNLRLITTDASLASVAWGRLKGLVPQLITLDDGSDWYPVGLNEVWRLAKYHPGDSFGTHVDVNYVRSKDEQSLLTVNAYMNGAFTGGKTRFFGDRVEGGQTRFLAGGKASAGGKKKPVAGADDEVAAVQGRGGDCLLFLQPPAAALRHDGEEVYSGVKYLFRSDVMYRRVGTEATAAVAAGAPGADDAQEEADAADAAGRAMLHEAECLEAARKFAEAIVVYNRLRRLHPKVAEEAGVV
jgi:hypothetical protein